MKHIFSAGTSHINMEFSKPENTQIEEIAILVSGFYVCWSCQVFPVMRQLLVCEICIL